MGKIIEEPILRDKLFVFRDRKHAGKILAEMLGRHDIKNAVVLAIPSGGVPIGYEISKALKIPFGLAIVKKIPIPYNPEAGYGAVAWNGEVTLNKGFVESLGLSDEEVEEGIRNIKALIRKRMEKFGFNFFNLKIKDRCIIIVDDGLASGITMLTAIKAIKKYSPEKIIVAIPTASEGSLRMISPHTDEIYCLNIRERYPLAVADAYKEWHDLTDEEVVEILNMLKKQV